MRNYRFNLVLLCLAVFFGVAKSQGFQEFNPDYSRAGKIIDEGLVIKTDVTLPVNGQKWPIVYSYRIAAPKPLYIDGSLIMRRFKNNSGNLSEYVVYTEPYVYYGILDLPDGSGRFYGIYTTGYNSLDDIVTLPKSKWHPYSDVILLSGEVVNNDGSTEQFLAQKRISKLKSDNLSKPSGTYWCMDKLGYTNIKLDFKAGGTGTLTCIHPRSSWILMSLGGSSSYRDRGTGRWKSHNSVTGGYRVWMRPTVSRPFKWSMEENGKIKLIPSGTSSVELKEGIDFDDNNQYYSSEAERKRHINQQKTDFQTNEEARSARKFFRAMAKNHLEKIDEIVITPYMLTNKEMMSAIQVKASDKKGLDYDSFSKDPEDGISFLQWELSMPFPNPQPFLSYFSSTQVEPDRYGLTMDLPTLLYGEMDDLLEKAKKLKPDGGKVGYDKMVDATRKFMGTYDLPHGCNYLVTDINPIERKAKMAFTNVDQIFFCDLFYDSDYSFKAGQSLGTLTESTILAENAKKISSQNELILSHKKDKNWNEIIREYEKDMKKAKANKLTVHFNTVKEWYDIVKKQEEILKIQEAAIKGI